MTRHLNPNGFPDREIGCFTILFGLARLLLEIPPTPLS